MEDGLTDEWTDDHADGRGVGGLAGDCLYRQTEG